VLIDGPEYSIGYPDVVASKSGETTRVFVGGLKRCTSFGFGGAV
jgi:hypothetical protein